MTRAARLIAVADIACRRSDQRWVFAEENAGAIARHWAARRRDTPALYDGRVLLARQFNIVAGPGGDILSLDVFETRFSSFLYWRDFGWPDQSVFNCFSMPAVRSVDGAFLLGEMGADHSNAGEIYFPCGTPDPSDVRGDGTVDLVGSLTRELAEETGLQAAPQMLADGWTIIFDGQRIACVKRIDWPQTTDALAAQARAFLATEARPELADVHVIARGDPLDDPRLPPFMVQFLSHAFANARGRG